MLTATLRLERRPASVPKARQSVVTCLGWWSVEHLCETVELLTDDVVRNAVLHGGGPRSPRPQRRRDPGQRPVAAGARAAAALPRRTTGRGVQLLDQPATSWEVLVEPDGKAIGFTVEAALIRGAAFRDDAWQDADL